MKFLLAKLLMSGSFLSPIIPVINVQNTIIYNKMEKEDISEYKFDQVNLIVKKSEEDMRTFVYMELAEKYEEYSDFLFDLLLNRDQYLISGDGFTVPTDPDGKEYKVNVVAKPTNEIFKGKSQIKVNLFPEIERVDLSPLSKLFDEENKSTYVNTEVIRNSIPTKLELSENEILDSLDHHFLILGLEDWTQNPHLLINEINNIEFLIELPHENHGYSESFFKVSIIPTNNSITLLPKALQACIHSTFNYEQISKTLSHSINVEVSANWSTVKKWNWENNEIWYEAMNLEDYLTDYEKDSSKGDFLKAFSNKYSEFYFDVSGQAIDYNGDLHKVIKPTFSLEKVGYETIYEKEVISFKMTGFGRYSEAHTKVSFKIDKENNLKYKINGYAGVQGFGASTQKTSINVKYNKWGVR